MCGLQLVAQKNISFYDAQAAFLRVDQGSKVVAAVESANAAATGLCIMCHMPGHLSKDCPHRDAIKNLVARRTGSGDASGRFVYIRGEKVWKPYKSNGSNNGSNANGSNNNAGKGNSSAPAFGAGASSTSAALVPSIANASSASAATESAGAPAVV